jgi:hypothetical protein
MVLVLSIYYQYNSTSLVYELMVRILRIIQLRGRGNFFTLLLLPSVVLRSSSDRSCVILTCTSVSTLPSAPASLTFRASHPPEKRLLTYDLYHQSICWGCSKGSLLPPTRQDVHREGMHNPLLLREGDNALKEITMSL